jgi:predicted PurR-regulated permease PerM
MITDDRGAAAGPPEQPRKRTETLLGVIRRFGRFWGYLAFIVLVVILFRGIVLPFVFAMLVAYLLAPVIARMEPKITRVGAVILVYVAILACLAAFFGLLLPAVFQDLAKLRDGLPQAASKLNDEWLPQATAWLQGMFGDFMPQDAPAPMPVYGTEIIAEPLPDGRWRLDLEGTRMQAVQRSDGSWILGPPEPVVEVKGIGHDVRALIMSKGAELPAVIGPMLQSFVAGVAGFLTSFVITFMLAAFVLLDVERVNRFIRSLVPPQFRPSFEELWVNMDKGLSGVIRGQLLICLVNGALTFLGLVIFGIKYSVLLGLLAGMFSLVPIFGTIISSLPIVIIALVSSGDGLSFGPALGILAWIAGIHLLEANVLNPKIIGDSAHIHPVLVVFALLAGEHVFGLVGALLAVPVASLVQVMFLHVRRHSTVFTRQSEPE